MFNGNLITLLCLIDQVDGPLYMRKIPLGVRPVFIFIFRLILVFFLKPRKNIFNFISFKKNQYKICTKRLFNEMFALKNQVISTIVLLSISNARGLLCGIRGIFSKNTSEHEFVIWWFFFFNQAICYSLLCFKFICIKMHSTFTFWFIVDLYTKQGFPNLSTAS